MLYILGKVQIVSGKCSTHIIVHLVTALCHLLELWNNGIIASLSSAMWTHFIIYFLTAINTKNNIGHFFVCKCEDFIIQQNSIRRKCKTEFLMIWFFQTPAICNQILNHLPVHQRFSTKEVHFQIHPVSGVCHKKIECLLSNFKAHQSPSSVVFTLFCKAIAAGKITIMRYMKTKCLHYRFPFFKVDNIVFVNVRGK